MYNSVVVRIFYLTIFQILFLGVVLADDTDTTTTVCSIHYIGVVDGQHEFSANDTFVVIDGNLSLSSATKAVCVKIGVDYTTHYNAIVATRCEDKLTKQGYPPPLCNAIIGNATKALYAENQGIKKVLNGELTTFTLSTVQQAHIDEALKLEAVQDNVTSETYSEYPKP